MAGKWNMGAVAKQANAVTNRMTISGMVSLRRSNPDNADENNQMQKHVRATIHRKGSKLNSSTIRIVG
jgi:hypothetical protein